jgi:hypothetical protein
LICDRKKGTAITERLQPEALILPEARQGQDVEFTGVPARTDGADLGAWREKRTRGS